VDALVIKDKDQLPFIPGKTLKGLVREAVENYLQFTGQPDMSEKVDKTFGQKNENMGKAFFTNATLPENEIKAIKGEGLQRYLYNKVSSTAIGGDGVAEDHCLRSMETVVPCTLVGYIKDVPEDMVEIITKSFGLIKRLGQKRNRGLGRCEFRKVEKGGIQ